MIKFSGIKLKELREQHHLTVRQLSSDIGVDRTSISRYENEQRVPSIEVVGKFAEYFNCPFETFLENVEDNN
ncbi:hypothetical protein A5819_003714 [Enterococcus sp. 7E2_DIV0204]|uniref:helix-turn-helix domain-containing protein n=1 Tax=unclassified Enterococcus TaxID=2608891 RepID=UPI000A34AA30|nr:MULTISPECIES: helix-turn-helix transcriptional regulator [unclassified Enterococcus]OTN83734.1 hypothetical protein A5819_003714 [Enterococcus sp. 7E2_DIV0204]OTP47157.1 hypothetical protein A5884_003694 [Enterococcus sp. 7D2_DIV0200]